MSNCRVSVLSVAALSTSCKKDSDVIPGGRVDSDIVGKWMYGSFSMSDFWTYNGTYAGKPFELAVVFDFKSNGTYEKYLGHPPDASGRCVGGRCRGGAG